MFEVPEALLRDAPPSRRAWLRTLPATVEARVRRWSLALGAPYSGLWLNFGAPAGQDRVLKIGDPADREFRTELEALRL